MEQNAVRRWLLMLQMAVVVFAIMYQQNPEFQRWIDYQMVKATGWADYGVRWLGWKLRGRLRAAERERKEDYGPELGQRA